MLTTLQRGGIPGPEGALAKVTTIKAAIAAGELLVDVLGPDGLSDDHWGELVSDLPGLKSAGGTEEILRNMVGERVLGLPPEPRLDKGVPFSELRAKDARRARMNFALSDEQEFLKEAARGALSRFKTVEAAREALDGGELPDLWPTAVEAGWPGLLVSEEHGGAGLGVMEGMLVFSELGRVLAGVALLGHLPATFLLDRAGLADEALAEGDTRAAYVPAQPPGDVDAAGRVDAAARLHARRGAGGRRRRRVTGAVAVGARRARGRRPRGRRARRARRARAGGATRRSSRSRATTATRSLGHVRFDGAPATLLEPAPAPRRRLVRRPGAAGRRVARRGRARARGVGRVRQGALHVRARDRLLPGGQARARGDPAAARERPLAHVLHGLGRPGQARGVPARRLRVPARGGPGARPRVERSPPPYLFDGGVVLQIISRRWRPRPYGPMRRGRFPRRHGERGRDLSESRLRPVQRPNRT